MQSTAAKESITLFLYRHILFGLYLCIKVPGKPYYGAFREPVINISSDNLTLLLKLADKFSDWSDLFQTNSDEEVFYAKIAGTRKN